MSPQKIIENKGMIYCAHSGETIKYSSKIVKFVYGKGYMPLDPFFTIPYGLGEELAQGNKEQCINDTISLMLHCDEIWIFGIDKEDFLKKEGVKKELEAWKKERETPPKFITWREVGISKYVPGSDWHDNY